MPLKIPASASIGAETSNVYGLLNRSKAKPYAQNAHQRYLGTVAPIAAAANGMADLKRKLPPLKKLYSLGPVDLFILVRLKVNLTSKVPFYERALFNFGFTTITSASLGV